MPKTKKMFIIFTGPPASGKGTQSILLGNRIGLPVISTGDLCRAEIKKKTKLGGRIKQTVTGGGIVSIDLISQLLDKRLAKKDLGNGFILDGYPRNLKQLNYLRKKFDDFEKENSIFLVFYIDISNGEVRGRLGGRRVCSCGKTYHLKYSQPEKRGVCDTCGGKLIQRKDDKPEVVTKRLRLFHKGNKPLISFFAGKDILIKINGEQKIKKIHRDIISILKGKKLLK